MEPWPEVSLCSSEMLVRASLCVKFVNYMELTMLKQQVIHMHIALTESFFPTGNQSYLHAVGIFAFYLALKKLLNCMRLIVYYLTND